MANGYRDGWKLEGIPDVECKDWVGVSRCGIVIARASLPASPFDAIIIRYTLPSSPRMAPLLKWHKATIQLIESVQLTSTEHILWRTFLAEAVNPEYAAQYIWERLHDNSGRSVKQILQEIKLDWKRITAKRQLKPRILLCFSQGIQSPSKTKYRLKHELWSKLGTMHTASCLIRNRIPVYLFVLIMLG